MNIRCSWLVVSIFVISFLKFSDGAKRSAQVPRLLIISLDGFRHDYLNEHQLPTINRFRSEGVRATQGMRPTFTTMTFPNHMSIATGMYPEDHGIIHNTFYDRLLKKTIGMGNRDDGQWSDPKVEPIWITATKQKVKSAALFWPACHNEFYGIRPLIYSWTYTDNISFREKIDNAIGYFRELPVQLVMLYHFEPDKQGHTYGPNSPEVRDALFRLDSDIEYLLNKTKNELDDDLNIIILSDHGMTNVTKVVRPFFEKYINRSAVETTVLSGALFNVMPRSGQTEQVMNNLKNIPNVTVYKRDEMPERFHYSKPIHRLGEITALPNEEGQILFEATTNSSYPNKGSHGWDNTLASMQAIFMARGPSFAKNTEIQSINNVDIYHIACQILNITPNPYATAGSLDNLTILFRPIEPMSTTNNPTTTTSTFNNSTTADMSTTNSPTTSTIQFNSSTTAALSTVNNPTTSTTRFNNSTTGDMSTAKNPTTTTSTFNNSTTADMSTTNSPTTSTTRYNISKIAPEHNDCSRNSITLFAVLFVFLTF